MATENKDDIIIAMLEEIKINNRNQKQPQIDLSKIDFLSDNVRQGIKATNDCSTRLDNFFAEVRKPIVSERRITIDLASKGTVFLFIIMTFTISVLGSALYFAKQPNYDRIDNDIKYRYIKMKGDASSERIAELENIFEINRDNTKIQQILKDVANYERTVKKRATLQVQARLKAIEVERLHKEAEEIKKK